MLSGLLLGSVAGADTEPSIQVNPKASCPLFVSVVFDTSRVIALSTRA